MTHIAKIIEIIGSSDKGWEDAAQVAVDEAKKTLHGIHGVEIIDMTAKVDPNSGKITQYRAAVKVAFCRTLIILFFSNHFDYITYMPSKSLFEELYHQQIKGK
jgi:flavin-binding protein dodecin